MTKGAESLIVRLGCRKYIARGADDEVRLAISVTGWPGQNIAFEVGTADHRDAEQVLLPMVALINDQLARRMCAATGHVSEEDTQENGAVTMTAVRHGPGHACARCGDPYTAGADIPLVRDDGAIELYDEVDDF